jgi:hypothetical protein
MRHSFGHLPERKLFPAPLPAKTRDKCGKTFFSDGTATKAGFKILQKQKVL